MSEELYDIKLTMDQWGVVLSAIRNSITQLSITDENTKILAIAEDRIVDMRFNSK